MYSWDSAAVLSTLILGPLLLLLFFFHEFLLEPGRFMSRLFPRQTPMLPFHLFRKTDTLLLMTINFATGASLMSAFYFISIYWEIAEGYSASEAGVQLLYYTPGIGVGVYTAMFLCNITPRQTFFPLLTGSVIEAVGIAVLAYACSKRTKGLVNGMLALSGIGTGLRFMPVVLHAAGIWPTRIAAVLSLMSFMIPFGGTLGIAMMGSVFTNKFNQALRGIETGSTDPAGSSSLNTNAPPSLNILNGLPAKEKSQVQHAAARAVM